MPVTAYIALGSNLGDRRATLDAALARLRATSGLALGRVSGYLETEPVGGPAGQGNYLNAVAEIQTDLPAPQLLETLLAIETELGRVRTERFGVRTLDLDLLLYGHDIVALPDLTVPHPRMHERRFVLAPLAEIAPLAVHPVLQSTAADLLRQLHRPVRDLAGLRAVVTGSTSGIGRAIAHELAAGGADILIHGRRSLESAQAVAQECHGLGVQGHALRADLRDETACRRFADEAWAALAGVDVWVNNAGADTLTGAAAKWSFERKLEELWLVDVRAAALLSRKIGTRMKERGRGVILNIGWDQAETGMEGDSGQLFGLTKGAVMAFTRSLAVSLAPEVRVNCIAPGWIRTAWGDQASAVWQERVRRETPLGRWGTPDDIARAARWLASPAAAFITGQTLLVNGGAVRT